MTLVLKTDQLELKDKHQRDYKWGAYRFIHGPIPSFIKTFISDSWVETFIHWDLLFIHSWTFTFSEIFASERLVEIFVCDLHFKSFSVCLTAVSVTGFASTMLLSVNRPIECGKTDTCALCSKNCTLGPNFLVLPLKEMSPADLCPGFLRAITPEPDSPHCCLLTRAGLHWWLWPALLTCVHPSLRAVYHFLILQN